MFHHHRSRLPIIVVDFSYKVKLHGGITAPISYRWWLASSSARTLVHDIDNSEPLVAKGVGRFRVKVRRGVVMLGGWPRRSSLEGQVVRVINFLRPGEGSDVLELIASDPAEVIGTCQDCPDHCEWLLHSEIESSVNQLFQNSLCMNVLVPGWQALINGCGGFNVID